MSLLLCHRRFEKAGFPKPGLWRRPCNGFIIVSIVWILPYCDIRSGMRLTLLLSGCFADMASIQAVADLENTLEIDSEDSEPAEDVKLEATCMHM